MKIDIQILRQHVTELKQMLENAETDLNNAIRSCHHNWSKPVTDHIYHKAYTIPGDPPGIMGVDWRGPTYVEAKTEKRWKRTCSECGEVQYTSNVKETVSESPDFGS